MTKSHLRHRRLRQKDAPDALGGRDDLLDEDAVEERYETLGHGALGLSYATTAKQSSARWCVWEELRRLTQQLMQQVRSDQTTAQTAKKGPTISLYLEEQ